MGDDTISRQAAIDVADKFSDANGCNGSDLATDIISGLISLPSAPPQKVCVAEIQVKIDDIKDYIDKAINAERWIPVSERLPETNGRYIVTRGLKACNSIWNRVYIINYSDLMGLKAEKIWWDGNVGKSDFQKIDDVIAWKPLEEPYKGEQE